MENINLEINTILKSADDFSSFKAVIMEPDVVDLHGDIASKEVIKKASHEYFLKHNKQIKIDHITPTKDIELVESSLLDEDKNFNGRIVKSGAWIGKFKVNSDEIKNDIRSGKFKGVSVHGKGLFREIKKSLNNPYEGKPLREIVDINDLDEISLVRNPANNQDILELQKSVNDIQNKGEKSMTFEEIMKQLNTDSELKKKFQEEFKEKKDVQKTEDEIKKGLDPQVLEILKAKEDRLSILEKAYEDNLRKEFNLKVEEVKKYSSCDENLVDCMMKISKSMPNEYKVLEKSLLSVVDTIEKLDKMKTVGVDNPSDLSKSSGFERIEVIAKDLMSKNSSLTKEQAISKVYTEKLY